MQRVESLLLKLLRSARMIDQLGKTRLSKMDEFSEKFQKVHLFRLAWCSLRKEKAKKMSYV